MSHVSKMDLRVMDLAALRMAAQALGLEMVEQDRYRWFGTFVGDSALDIPEGFTKADLGHCKYVLRIPGRKQAYEVGVAEAKDGQGGYVLLWDYWQGGYGLMDHIGQKGGRLKQEYSIARTVKKAESRGQKVTRTVNKQTGKPMLVVEA
jgi:hypothetical protein